MKLYVAKFGGTSIGNGERIKKAAQSVVNEYMKGNQMVVVVSAVNKTTDELITLSDEAIGSSLTDKQKATIVSMGEMTSTRVFSATLESLGVKSAFVDPFSEIWPVITDSNPLEAEINFKATNNRMGGIKELLDQGIIPVICGFLGKDENNEITTLGRGGSDITGFLLGHCLDANEVIIVTDVDGVMSTDPNKIEGAEKLNTISVEEMRDLATHGAQVLHPHALRYKDPSISAKIISYEFGDLSNPGTRITGPTEDGDEKAVALYPNPIAQFALVADGILEKPGILNTITGVLAEEEINILGISAGRNSLTVFMDKKYADTAYPALHKCVIDSEELSSVSSGKEVAMIIISGPDFVDTPGIISSITEPLRTNNINIVEVSTSQTAVVVYVDWEDGKEAHHLLKDLF